LATSGLLPVCSSRRAPCYRYLVVLVRWLAKGGGGYLLQRVELELLPPNLRRQRRVQPLAMGRRLVRHLTAMQKPRIVTLGISGGGSLTRPLRDARRFPSKRRWYPVPGATRTTSGLGFVHHSRAILSRAVPNPTITIRNFCIAVSPAPAPPPPSRPCWWPAARLPVWGQNCSFMNGEEAHMNCGLQPIRVWY
jgi:hypothetical protein